MQLDFLTGIVGVLLCGFSGSSSNRAARFICVYKLFEEHMNIQGKVAANVPLAAGISHYTNIERN